MGSPRSRVYEIPDLDPTLGLYHEPLAAVRHGDPVISRGPAGPCCIPVHEQADYKQLGTGSAGE